MIRVPLRLLQPDERICSVPWTGGRWDPETVWTLRQRGKKKCVYPLGYGMYGRMHPGLIFCSILFFLRRGKSMFESYLCNLEI